MKLSSLFRGAALAVTLLGSVVFAADRARQVNVFMYSEYNYPEMPAEFEKLTGMKCQIDTYEKAEELVAKMQHGGGVSQYDVIVVSDFYIPTLVDLKLVQPLDMAKIPNAKNIAKDFINPPFDPGNKHGLPYQWGTVGLIYNKTKVKGDISWSLVFDPKQQPGSFLLMDSTREMTGSALKYLGFSTSTTNPDEIQKALVQLKAAKKSANCLGFEGGAGGKNRVAAGEATMAVVYNGDAVRAIAENDKLGFAVPKEGGVKWVDMMLIPSKAPNLDGAQKFMNFILDPEVGAKLSNFNRYATPNAASLPKITPADLKDPAIYPSEEMMKKLEFVVDVRDKARLYDEAWTSLKAD